MSISVKYNPSICPYTVIRRKGAWDHTTRPFMVAAITMKKKIPDLKSMTPFDSITEFTAHETT